MQELLVELDSVYQPDHYANPDGRDEHCRFSARASWARWPARCSALI
ncbi:hypothetical protein [Streptomyces sp. NPDC048248]